MIWFTDSLPSILVTEVLDPNGNPLVLADIPEGALKWAFEFVETEETKRVTATITARGALFTWTDRAFFGDPEVGAGKSGDVYNGLYIDDPNPPAGTLDMVKDTVVRGFKRP